MSSAKKLFLVVLGGRCRGCHTEQHDVRWVVGDAIEDTYPQLIKQDRTAARTSPRQLSRR